MEIKNATVLITGGSSGIGFETAGKLKEAGAQVIITGKNGAKLDKAAADLGITGIVADVSKEHDVIRMVQKVIQKFGSFNVLINNAGYGYFDQLTDMNLEKFNAVFAVNVAGAMLAARESAKHFIANQYGNIINIASTAGKSGFAYGTAYSASKFALSSMTECWRAELRKFNIRVMQVNPSEVQTEFYMSSGSEERPYNPTKLQAEEIAHTICSMLQMEDRGFITEATVWATNPREPKNI